MEHTIVAGTDLQVSRIGLGTWAMGGWMWGGTDEQQALRTLAVIATKLGLQWQGEKVHRNNGRERIFLEIEESLRRLGTDHIDIYQVHWPDPLVPAQETAEALSRLLEQGKIRAIGVSNFSPDQMNAFAQFAPLHTSQPPYNLFERDIEVDVLPHCRENGITTLMYGALCRGMLSGRMRADTKFDGDDIRKVDPKFRGKRRSQYLAAVSELENLAHDLGKTVVQLAVRWVLDQSGAHVALWGARNPTQLEPLDGVCGWSLSEQQLARIDEIVARNVVDPVGPEFMAPPFREAKA